MAMTYHRTRFGGTPVTGGLRGLLTLVVGQAGD